MKASTTYCWWVRGRQFAEYAALSIGAAQRVDQGGCADRKFLIVTDEADPDWRNVVAPFGSGVQFRVIPSSQPTISARLDAQIEVLMGEARGDRVLFLDADALMVREFPWEPDADLYLTWRDHVNGDRDMARLIPYNGGVVGASVTPATIEAFIWLRARIRRMSAQNQLWNGDQLAIADLVGGPRAEALDVQIRWALTDVGTPLRVRCLPCETWNYSPDKIGEDISERAIIHLKGNRKDLIEHYARRLAA